MTLNQLAKIRNLLFLHPLAVSIISTILSGFKIQTLLKFITALPVSAYSAIIRGVWRRNSGNCSAFRATAIDVFIFTVLLTEVHIVSLHMPHALLLVLLLAISGAVCSRWMAYRTERIN
jgi:hypothetical protein